MSDPTVLISHFRIKGDFEVYRRLHAEASERLRAEKPGTVVFLAYGSNGGTELTIVHVFPDADAMDRHFEGSAERGKVAFEFLVPRGWEIYGPAGTDAVETMRRLAESWGVDLTLLPDFVGGFLRTGSDRDTTT